MISDVKRPNNSVTTSVKDVNRDPRGLEGCGITCKTFEEKHKDKVKETTHVNEVNTEGEAGCKEMYQDNTETERSAGEQVNGIKGDGREGQSLSEVAQEEKGEAISVESFQQQFSKHDEKPGSEKRQEGDVDYAGISDEKLDITEPVERHNGCWGILKEERGKEGFQESTGYIEIFNENFGTNNKECIKHNGGYLGMSEGGGVENESFEGKSSKDKHHKEYFGNISEKQREKEQGMKDQSDCQNRPDQFDGKGCLGKQWNDKERVREPSNTTACLVERCNTMESLGEQCSTKVSLGRRCGTEEHAGKLSDSEKRLEENCRDRVPEIRGNEDILEITWDSKKRLEEERSDGASEEVCSNKIFEETCDSKKRLEEQCSDWFCEEICGNEEILVETNDSKNRLEEQRSDEGSDDDEELQRQPFHQEGMLLEKNGNVEISVKQNGFAKFPEGKRSGEKPLLNQPCDMRIFEKQFDTSEVNGVDEESYDAHGTGRDSATLHHGVGCFDEHDVKKHQIIYRRNQSEDSFSEMETVWLPGSSDESESSSCEETGSDSSCDETPHDPKNVPISGKDFGNILEAYLEARASGKSEDIDQNFHDMSERIIVANEPRTLVGQSFQPITNVRSPSQNESYFPIGFREKSEEQPFQTSDMNSDRDKDDIAEEQSDHTSANRNSVKENNSNPRGFEETEQNSEDTMFYGASADDLSAYLSALPAKWKQVWYRSYEGQTKLISTYTELYLKTVQ